MPITILRRALVLTLACSPAFALAPPFAPLGAQDGAARDEGSWLDYRGPTWDGRVGDADLPLTWSEKESVRWKTRIHGRGWSTPVVQAGRAWLTTATPDGKELSLICVDTRTGAILFDEVLIEVDEPQHRNALNSYASPSAALEPGRVYAHFGSEGTVCLDSQTRAEIWRRTDLNCDHMEGPGSSPILLGDRLVVNVDGGDVQYVVALDKNSGETLWKSVRTTDLEGLPKDLRKAYSTPIVLRSGRERVLISSGARRTTAYSPADGREVWRVDHPGFSMSSRPVTDGELVILNTGFMRAELWAVRLGGKGDVTKSHVAWVYNKNVPTMPSAVLADGRLYMVNDGGIATCLDAREGKVVWRERIGGEHSASPVLAKGRLYFFDRTGKTTVVAAADEFAVLAESRLDDGFMASPVVLGDAFLLRTKTHLYRIEAASEPGGGGR